MSKYFKVEFILVALILFFLAMSVNANAEITQTAAKGSANEKQLKAIVEQAVVKPPVRQVENGEHLKTPNSEVEDAIVFLQENYNDNDANFIRFFTTYAIQDKQKRQEQVLTLSYILHSLVGLSKDNPS
jgi:hypothetical protein